MYNIIAGFFPPPLLITWYINTREFGYYDYLAIVIFKSLLYFVGVAGLLNKQYSFIVGDGKV